MKKLLLTIPAIGLFNFVNAQCTELFFSEYVEGSNNNKALEIYNPTPNAVSLSNYRIVRWSNGATNSDQDIRYVQPLSGIVPPYGTYVAILDRRDPSGTGMDTILFAEILNFGNTCNAGFYSPDYNSGTQGARTMPFNGDDAITLEKFNGVSYVRVDIFGLIGERPQTSTGGTSAGWTNTPNYWDGIGAYWTKDQTLIRKYNIGTGVIANPGIPYSIPGAFNPTILWDSLPENTFDRLGFHDCACNPANICKVITDSVINPASCGAADGAIYISLNEGWPFPYSYSWNNGDTTEDISGLTAGTYTFIITDCSNNCSDIATFNISDIGAPSLTITDTTMVSVFGGNDGSATVTPSGGIPTYTYLWNTTPAQTDSTATGLSAGIYSVDVTDSAGCVASIFIGITNPPVGIKQNDLSVKFNIYPNPAFNNQITITSDKILKSVDGYNVLGQMVYQSGKIENMKQFVLNLNEIKSGIYFITVNFIDYTKITKRIMLIDSSK